MRTIVAILVMAITTVFVMPATAHAAIAPLTDTVKAKHITDGYTTEWPADRFEQNRETGTQYSMDHDTNHLYIVITTANLHTQAKMMTTGMNLYIDIKGKKRESMGIAFPVKNNAVGLYSPSGPAMLRGDQQPNGPGLAAFREKMAENMIFLTKFGFQNQAEEMLLQMINQENDINIAFGWDEADMMYIEYAIPLRLIGTKEALHGKTISIGWKLPAAEMPQSSPQAVTSTIAAVPAGSRNSRPVTGSQGRVSFPPISNPMTREQQCWSKYLIHFQ